MKRILFALQRTLGDVILGTPIIEELKRRYPDAEITWAIHPQYVEIADTNPHIKGLVISEEHDVLLQEVTNGRYDMVLVPAQLNHTDTCWHHREKYKHGHLVDFYARRCGVEIAKRETKMYFTEDDWDAVQKYTAADDRASKDGLVIAIHTMTRVPSKDWNQFGEFVAALKEKYKGCQVLQIGGPDDTQARADVDLRAKLTYNQIAALLSMCDLFVGVDSGLAYISDSVKCPSIVIMGMSTASTSGPISGRTTFIEPDRPEGCESPCHSNCRHNAPCIQRITVEEVMKHVEEKIGNGHEGDKAGNGDAGTGDD